MNTGQTDRDKLRQLQQKLNPEPIGSLVENPVQDPRKYKRLSKQRMDQQDSTGALHETSGVCDSTLEISYKSVYLTNDSKPPLVREVQQKEKTEKFLQDFQDDIQVEPWLNIDQLEFDKLEWMSLKSERAYQEKLKNTTQFDKDGRAVSTKDLITKNHEATYDIESLVQLLDSAYQPQITYALNVIMKIADLAVMGYYDGAFDENIHGILIKNCLLRVRHQMDNTNETICLNALKCMRSLICNTRVDEIVLDRINSLLPESVDANLWLQTDEMSLREFTIDMKDNECVEIDSIRALVERTDILARISYLMQNKSDKSVYIDCILDILIRIARHSPDICYSIHQTNIMKRIIGNHLPLSAPSENLLVKRICLKSLKLVRITALAANEMELIHAKLPAYPSIDTKIFVKVMQSIEAYFMIDCCDQSAVEKDDPIFKLHVETLRTLKALCLLKSCHPKIISLLAFSGEKLYRDCKAFLSFDPMKKTDSTISFDWQYAAHFIDLCGFIMKYDGLHTTVFTLPPIWINYIRPAILRWLKIILSYKMIPKLDVSIAVATGVYYYNISATENELRSLSNLLIEDYVAMNTERNCLGFYKRLVRESAEKSQLPHFIKNSGRLRDPKSLPSYGSLNFNTSPEHRFKIINVFENDSPYILMNMYISELLADRMGSHTDSKPFINNVDLIRYINCVTNYNKLPVSYEPHIQQSIFAQYEVQIACRSLLTLSKCYTNFTRSEEVGQPLEPIEDESKRCDSFSNMVFHVISVLGLLNPNNELNINLKDQLLENVFLDNTVQKLLFKESFDKSRESDNHFESGSTGQGWFKCEQIPNGVYTYDKINIVAPVYISCEQPNRFWIFQPLIDYYYGKTSLASLNKKNKNKKKDFTWFQRNINWRSHTGELAKADDINIINCVLRCNYAVMRCSPNYTHLIIEENIEDYLCIIGSLFLNDSIFLEGSIAPTLQDNLKFLIRNCLRSKFTNKPVALFQDAKKIIGPLDLPLADFFNKLVEQYESVSYCDEAFANFILLFIGPTSDKFFKKKLFQEKADTCLSQIRIGLDQVWARKEIYFSSVEKDSEILELIQRSSIYFKHLPSSFLSEYCSYYS